MFDSVLSMMSNPCPWREFFTWQFEILTGDFFACKSLSRICCCRVKPTTRTFEVVSAKVALKKIRIATFLYRGNGCDGSMHISARTW